MAKRKSNKQIKAMMVTVCENKMNHADNRHDWMFSWYKSKLCFKINRSRVWTLSVVPIGVASIR